MPDPGSILGRAAEATTEMAKRSASGKPTSVVKTSELTVSKPKRTIKKSGSKPAAETPVFDIRRVNSQDLYDNNVNKRDTSLNDIPYSDAVMIGIPIPFPMQILIGCSVMQLGIVAEANGPPESGKTTLLYEFGRWFRDASGWLEMVVSENKISVELARSIIGWDIAGLESFHPWFASDLEEMMSLIQDVQHRATEKMKLVNPYTKKTVGGTFPVLIGVDSIMGTNSSESNAKIMKDGSPGRSWPVEALKLNPFMKKIAADIAGKPQMVFLINHRKESKKDPSRPYDAPEFTKPGGKAIQFQDTYEFIVHGSKTFPKLETNVEGGLETFTRNLTIKVGKNSAGISGRQIVVPYTWCHLRTDAHDAEGNPIKKARQRTIFRWNQATTDLLFNWQQAKWPGADPKTVSHRTAKLDEILHLRREKGNFWSKTLDIPKSEAVDAATFGRMVVESPEVLAELQQHFAISKGKAWVGGTTDYERTRRKLMRVAAEIAMSQRDSKVQRLTHEYSELSLEDNSKTVTARISNRKTEKIDDYENDEDPEEVLEDRLAFLGDNEVKVDNSLYGFLSDDDAPEGES